MTDNLYEFRKFILKDFMKMGYKYIARDKNGKIYAFSSKPIRRETAWVVDIPPYPVDKLKDISLVSALFTDIKWEDEKPFEIPCVNWKEIPADTPVVYTNDNGEKFVRHFCKYDEEHDRVVLYAYGRTSFTEKGIMETCPERVSIYGEEEERNVLQGGAVNVFMV